MALVRAKGSQKPCSRLTAREPTYISHHSEPLRLRAQHQEISYNTGTFAAPVSVVAGNFYYLEVTSSSLFDRNFFYNWNGLPNPVNVGDVTIIDGALGNDLTNSVAPALLLDIQAVPEPATFAVLGIGIVGILRRKRSKI